MNTEIRLKNDVRIFVFLSDQDIREMESARVGAHQTITIRGRGWPIELKIPASQIHEIKRVREDQIIFEVK